MDSIHINKIGSEWHMTDDDGVLIAKAVADRWGRPQLSWIHDVWNCCMGRIEIFHALDAMTI